MKRIALDGEWKLDRSRLWVVKTINVDSGEIRTWNEANSFRAYIEDATLVIAHNGISSDFRVLTKLWNTKMTMPVFDTLVVSKLLKPNREGGHSLAAWGEKLGKAKIDYEAAWCERMERKQKYHGECYDFPVMDLLDSYCEQDVVVLRDLFLHLDAEWKRSGFSEECLELEYEVAEIIAQQECNGFKLDLPYTTCLLAELRTKLSVIDDAMQERFPPVIFERISEKTGKKLKDGVLTFNPASRQQVGAKLVELGWKPSKFTPTGQPQVDEDTLKEVKIPEASLIVEYFMLQKRIGQVESWIEAVGRDGRVHGRVDALGAATGRMTHSKPNMAQIPNSDSPYGPECRECWTVEEGNVLVGCDASGLELRMLAHYMGDDKYTEAVINGKQADGTDIHTVNQKAAGLETRSQAKTFIYAFLYGAGDAKIGSIVGGNAKAGSALKAKFLQGVPALKRLKERLTKSCERGYCQGLDGRRIAIESDHSALNYLLQGGGAIAMKKALVLFHRKCVENKWPVKLVANVHDELQWETKPEFAEVTGKACVEAIREAGDYFKMKCPLDGEYKSGKNWRMTH